MQDFCMIHLVITCNISETEDLEAFYKENKMSITEKSKIIDACVKITSKNHYHIPISTKSLSFYKHVPINPKYLVMDTWSTHTVNMWGSKWDAQECFHYLNDNKLQYFLTNKTPPIKWLEKIAKIYTKLRFVMYIKYNCNKTEIISI